MGIPELEPEEMLHDEAELNSGGLLFGIQQAFELAVMGDADGAAEKLTEACAVTPACKATA